MLKKAKTMLGNGWPPMIQNQDTQDQLLGHEGSHKELWDSILIKRIMKEFHS